MSPWIMAFGVPRTIEAGAGLLQLFESSVTLRVVRQAPTPAAPFTVVGATDTITVVFSAAVDPATVNATTFRVTQGTTTGAPVAGTYVVTGPTVTFTPTGGSSMVAFIYGAGDTADIRGRTR